MSDRPRSPGFRYNIEPVFESKGAEVIKRVGPIVVLFLSSLWALTSLGQDESSLVPLRITDQTQIDSLHINARAIGEWAGEKVFYFESGPGKYVSVDLDGETHKALDLASIPVTEVKNPQQLSLMDLVSASHGDLLATVISFESKTTSRTALVEFNSDGEYDKLVWLDTDLTVTHAVEFNPSGNFLVVGYDDQYQMKVALFDFRGFLMKEQVVAYADKEGAVPKGVGKAAQREFKNHVMVETGSTKMASAPDDSVYIYNQVWGHKILRVASDGSAKEISLGGVQRTTVPMHLVVSSSYIYLSEALLDEGRKPETGGVMKRSLVSVYDRYTGSLYASYEIKDALGMVFLPVSPREFYFPKLTVPPGGAVGVSLIREEP